MVWRLVSLWKAMMVPLGQSPVDLDQMAISLPIASGPATATPVSVLLVRGGGGDGPPLDCLPGGGAPVEVVVVVVAGAASGMSSSSARPAPSLLLSFAGSRRSNVGGSTTCMVGCTR